MLFGRKSNLTFQTFLSGMPARDYMYQKTPYEAQIKQAAEMIREAEFILVGAGAGLSAAAGLTMGGSRFTENFKDFIEKYGGPYMTDMYSAGFYPFRTEEAKWGYWSKSGMVNRVLPGALPLYRKVYQLAADKPHFVLTTNVDHQFFLSGFDEKKVFATQGDYGLIQCRKGCHPKTYDAVEMFQQMDQARKDCLVPSYLVPKCPVCGGPMEMNLRCDQYFVEDGNWHQAERRFSEALSECETKRTVLLELGAGFNTPTIIRFPFEKLVREYNNMSLIRLNMEEAVVPESFGDRAVGINEDMRTSIEDLLQEVGS
ncbi:MAG: Sir2 silent information regulator family NAD-dependent deacetylase [Lachnospiraceae bacterium]|nr:Sir2 silent information regulator family NAD-dependent deacetylase [Lachnospiraceae bacterium]